MADFVIDEWLWEDLAGRNGPDRQEETETLLLAIFEICDRLVLVKGSRFEDKTVGFWKDPDTHRRKVATFYRNTFPYNSSKSRLLDQSRLGALPDALAQDVKLDDRYLIQAGAAVPESVIVTTDEDLAGACAKHGISCRRRDEFVQGYLAQYRARPQS